MMQSAFYKQYMRSEAWAVKKRQRAEVITRRYTTTMTE